MTEDFIARRHGSKKVQYLHPWLEPILADTYGVIVYQEQVMQIASQLAGFTLGQADMLRRAMGKKRPEVIAGERQRFIAGAKKNNIDGATASQIFDLMEYFAGYGFNKSHSAAYAMLAYETAYLKANWQPEFMAALMTSVMDDTDKVALYCEECKRLGLKVLPPDVNSSAVNFSVENGQIRFGLAAVKNVGRKAIENLVLERELGGQFNSLDDMCQRIDLSSISKRALESLIKAGATHSLAGNRAQQLAVLEQAIKAGQAYQRERKSGQGVLWDLEVTSAKLSLPDLPEIPSDVRLAWEKETLGLYLSGHPLARKAELLRQTVTAWSNELAGLIPKTQVVMGGIINSLKEITTRTGEPMVFLTVEDMTGVFEVIIFPRLYSDNKWLQSDQLIILTGELAKQDADLPQVIAHKLLPLSAMQALYLQLDSASKVSNRELYAELAPYPGDSPVFVFFAQDQRLVQLDRRYNVRLNDDLLAELKQLLGPNNVAVKIRKL